MPNPPDPPPRSDDEVVALARQLRDRNRRTLLAMPIADIASRAGQAVAGWGRGGVSRNTAQLDQIAASTGYPRAQVAAALDDIATTFDGASLRRLLDRELGDPVVLDRFVAGAMGRRTRAYGPALTVTVLAGNVPQVAVEAMLLTALTKSAGIVKASSRDYVFPGLFASSLLQANAAAIQVMQWAGGQEAFERKLFAEADLLVVYGGAEAVTGVRAQAPPGTPLIVHGPKLSLAVVDAAQADEATATAAAHDVAYLDQQGCVSPHTIYVHGPASAGAAFARLLAASMEQEERRSPRRELSPAEASAIQQARGAAEFRPGAEVYTDAGGTAWTVIYDPDPAFAASCLNRLVYVKPLASLDHLPTLLAPVSAFLQTVGVAGDSAFTAAVAGVVAAAGACRVCRLGQMQRPPLDWPHDGRPRLLDRLRWVQIED